jgi:hypothetical protein
MPLKLGIVIDLDFTNNVLMDLNLLKCYGDLVLDTSLHINTFTNIYIYFRNPNPSFINALHCINNHENSNGELDAGETIKLIRN